MIVVQALLIAGVPAAEIRCHPLDERTVYLIRLAKDEPTTCVFPGPLTALEGGNVSSQAGDDPPVLLSYQPGASFFSLRPLRDDARGALNAVYRGKVYALTFVTGKEVDRAVVFQEAPAVEAAAPAPPRKPEDLRNLLERARHHAQITERYPALARSVERTTPGTETLYPGFKLTITELFRFEDEDTLVFSVRLTPFDRRPVRYDPSGIAVRAGAAVFPAALAVADPADPSDGTVRIWFAVAGDGQGGRAHLSPFNTFLVLLPVAP
jgi:hypothetical protein